MALIVAQQGPLVDFARTAGIDTSVIPFPGMLARLGDAAAGGPAGNSVGGAELIGRMLMSGPGVGAYVLRLRRAIRAAAPQVVHTNGLKMHILGAIAAPRGLPLLWNIRDFVSRRPLMRRMLRAFAGRCSIAVTNSKSVARDLRSVCGTRLKRVVTVCNAINLTEFCPHGPKLDLDKLSGMPPANEGVVRVGLLATLARWKGQEVFLRSLSMLPESSQIRGYIIGGSLYETRGSQYSPAELRQIGARLGVSSRVGFTGFVQEPAAAMRALDIIVHASTEPEPFGRVIAEGMACGRAVVASAAGGVSEIASDGENALLHPCGDAGVLAERIMWLASNPALRAKLGAAGRINTELRFGRSRMAAELIDVYRTICPAALS
jgi:glycosyltransferase involved in cell wall biosynthesis